MGIALQRTKIRKDYNKDTFSQIGMAVNMSPFNKYGGQVPVRMGWDEGGGVRTASLLRENYFKIIQFFDPKLPYFTPLILAPNRHFLSICTPFSD